LNNPLKAENEMTIKKRVIFCGILLFLSLWFSGCEKLKEKGLGEMELVRINDANISLEEFRQMSEGQSLEGKMRLLSEKGLRDFLDNYVITREVLYQEAKKKGLLEKKEIVAKVEDFRRAMVIDALLEEELRGKNEVSENEIRQYYKDNVNLFTEPKEVKIRHIFVNSDPVLQEVLMKLQKGENFEKLASTYNVDKSREDGGNIGWITRGQLSPAFAQYEEVAFSLRKKGEVGNVIKTPVGYYIIRLEDTRGSTVKSFDQVKEKIRFFLQAKKKQDAYLDYVQAVKSRAKIVVNEKLWAEEEKKELKPKEERK
jgi:peptidyl-prolyl cis-trans isomerase C